MNNPFDDPFRHKNPLAGLLGSSPPSNFRPPARGVSPFGSLAFSPFQPTGLPLPTSWAYSVSHTDPAVSGTIGLRIGSGAKVTPRLSESSAPGAWCNKRSVETAGSTPKRSDRPTGELYEPNQYPARCGH
jgi:hypothetical protein